MRRCAHNSSVATQQRHGKKEQHNSSCEPRARKGTCLHKSSTHSISNGCSALGPTALEDYLISEQQDAHVEKSRMFAFSVQDSFLMLLSHAPKLLTVQRLWKTRILRQREKICLRCLRPAKTSGTDGTKQNIPLCQPSTPTEGRVSSPYKKLCTAKQVQREADTTQGRERIRHFMFAAALQTQHKTSSHTCMTCLQIDSASHWTLYDIVSHNAVQCATTTGVKSHELFATVSR